MYKTNGVSNRLKCLTNTIRDTSENLKSLDYLVLNPITEPHIQPNYFTEKIEKSDSFSKIEHSLDNIYAKQNLMEDEMKRMSYSLKDCNSEAPNFRNFSKLSQKAASTNYLDNLDHYTEATFNVNKKLQEAQDKLRNDRILLENRNSSFNKTIDLSPDLKLALGEKTSSQKSPIQVENQQLEVLTKRIIKAESENSSLKFEFDSLKRQVLNETGAKNSLLSKIENTKSRIHDLEEENISTKKELDRMTMENEVNKKKAENNTKWQEKLSTIQWENEQLKLDTRHCNHPMEIEELRRQKEKAERSKASMKDQISDMIKQTDSKQAHVLKLMDEVRDLQEKMSSSKSKYQDLDERFHESQNELKHRQQMYQEAMNKIDSLEHSTIELEAHKNKGFSIRDDNIERLEKQCSRFKTEMNKYNIQIQESNVLMNDLHKENESLRTQLTNVHAQTDALRREMEALIKARSVQDEMLKRHEEENESCRNTNKDLQILLENTEQTGEMHKFDAEIYNQELNKARQTIAVQEERVLTLTTTNLSQQEQLLLYKSELSSLTRKCTTLETQLNHYNQQLMDYKHREENIELLRRQLEESQDNQEKMSVDIIKKSKKFELEKDINMKKLEQMLEAERAAMKVVMNKCDRQVLELNRLHQEYWTREQLVQRFRKKYVKVKEDLENLIKQKDVDKQLQENRLNYEIIEQEQESNLAKERLSDVIEERDQTLRWIIVDIDGMVELLSQIDVFSHENSQLKSSTHLMNNYSIDLKSCPPTSSALSTLGGLDVSKCFIDIKSKLSRSRSEINRLINHLENYKNINLELQEELSIANERLDVLEEEKQMSKNIELEEARRCIAKLRVKEKNETNLQLKCDRLQEELHDVRRYLKDNIGDCNIPHCQVSSYN